MNFTFPIRLTEEIILSKLSDIEIFNYYFMNNIKPGKLYCSKLRVDNRPTVGFFSKGQRLFYHDFGTGDTFNCFGYVMRLFNISYYKALKKINSDFNLIKDAKINISINKPEINDFAKRNTIIQVECKKFVKQELDWWKQFGITKEILNMFNVYSCKTLFLNGKIIGRSSLQCPIYGYYGKKHKGIELWKIYMPTKKEFRFLGNYPKNKIQGYEQLPKNGDTLVITKSLKDVMCLFSLGYYAIAPNSEVLFISKELVQELKKRFKRIIVFYDNDKTGMYNMGKIRKDFPELNFIIIPKKYKSKDISDFYRDYGREKTIKLCKQYMQWLEK